MALTFRRWLAAAVILCAISTLVLFTTKKAAQSRLDEFIEDQAQGTGPDSARLVALRREADSLERLQRSVRTLMRRATIRDSTLALLGSKPAPELTIDIDSRIPPKPRALFHDAASSAFAAATSGTATTSSSPRVPVVVAVVLDSTPGFRGTPGVVLTQVAATYKGNPLCLAIVEAEGADPFSAPAALVDPKVLTGRILGQCAFDAAYGPPGPRVAAWLEQNPTLAQDTRWNEESLPILDDPSMRSEYLAADESGFLTSLLLRRVVSTPPRRFLGPTALACDAGDSDLCTSTVAQREDEREPYFALPEYAGRMIFGANRLGPREVSLLADMAHDLGPAKFGAFWHSTQPLPAAFQDATHESLGDWTYQWVQRLYGPVHVGPAPTTSTVLGAFALMLVGVGIAIGITQRRTVA